MNRWLCGVKSEYCQGSKTKTSAGLRDMKTHDSSLSAFRCMAHYLVKIEGRTQIGPREFLGKDGVRVLTKKSRFGSRLRYGKLGERFMPEKGGVIVG